MDVTQTTDYVDDKLFENNVLDRIFVDGGYIKGGVYYFYETDHLGDNRVVVSLSGSSLQNTDYYPFGKPMQHSVSVGAQPYKFGGKEYDTMHGVDWYDFSARSHDPALGRFTTVDPKAEKYYSISPYAYCGNNPIRLVDVNGKEWGIIVNANGTMTITLNTTISSGSNLNLTAAQLDAYKTAISTQLNSTISEASGGLISASISFDGAKDPSLYTPNIVLQGGSGDMALGLSVGGSEFVNLNVEKAESSSEFAETATHELLHTLTLGDMADTPNIIDTRMISKYINGKTEYFTTESTDKNIRSNVMNYGSAKIDGLSYRDIYHSGSGMNKLTKEQLNYIIRQVYKQMQGYGVMPKQKENESQNDYDKRVNKYYWDYWN